MLGKLVNNNILIEDSWLHWFDCGEAFLLARLYGKGLCHMSNFVVTDYSVTTFTLDEIFPDSYQFLDSSISSIFGFERVYTRR